MRKQSRCVLKSMKRYGLLTKWQVVEEREQAVKVAIVNINSEKVFALSSEYWRAMKAKRTYSR